MGDRLEFGELWKKWKFITLHLATQTKSGEYYNIHIILLVALRKIREILPEPCFLYFESAKRIKSDYYRPFVLESHVEDITQADNKEVSPLKSKICLVSDIWLHFFRTAGVDDCQTC
ncbi:MAG: hypothetical protein SCH66_02345 [Methanolobus sp.]|nr:hypothetical protein [Methanolobus sp.]